MMETILEAVKGLDGLGIIAVGGVMVLIIMVMARLLYNQIMKIARERYELVAEKFKDVHSDLYRLEERLRIVEHELIRRAQP